jgi:hypothetical protein
MNDGMLMFGIPLCELGERVNGVIQPLAPEYWQQVQKGDVLKCFEGVRQTGEAIVIGIYDELREEAVVG